MGLLFLSLALISGLSMQSIFTANLIFKAVFTFIAWLIFVITVLGVKYFNFENRKLWLNDYLDQHGIAYVASNKAALDGEFDKGNAKITLNMRACAIL